ncbi:MAG: pilus assembly protein PilM [Agathobacter sp.]|nr:pilus assembly protein PilM [Agathobacter sp.]
MANKVLGIEIGQNFTRVVEIDYKTKKNPKIYNIFDFATPQDMMADGVIQDVSMFRSLLATKLKENKVSTKKVLFVLNSARIATREVEIPAVKDKQIKEMITMNASDYFPVDLEQYQIVHEVLDRIEVDGDKKIKVSVIAVPKDLIRSYELLANACKLQLVGLDYTGNAIKQLMIQEIPGEIKATVKVDENMTLLTIMDGNEVKLQRIINYGIAEAIEEIQDSEIFGEYMSFSQAMDIARRRTCISIRSDGTLEEQRPVNPDEHSIDAERINILRGNVTMALSSLISSLSRVIDYYQSRNPEKPIEKIFLIGMGADFSGLSKLLTAELNYKVIPLQQFEGIYINKNLKTSNFKVAEYFTCIGASLNPLDIVSGAKSTKISKTRVTTKESPDGEVVEVEEEVPSFGVPILICGLFIVASIGLVAYSIFSNLVLKTDNVTLQNQVNELEYAQELCDTYNSTKGLYEWTKALDAQTFNRNNELVSFIEELEKKMPSDVHILSMSASTAGIDLNITVKSKEAVADVISQLRTLDSVDITSVSTISIDKEKADVNFSVSCQYVAKVESTEEDTKEGEESTTESQETEQNTEQASSEANTN